MKKIEINNNTFQIKNYTSFFPFRAYEALIDNNRLIVCFDWTEIKDKMHNFDYRRSIWCYDLKGNLLWQIEPPYFISHVTGERKLFEQPFTSIKWFEPDKKVIAYSDRGYEVDPETGRLSNDFEIR